MQPRPVQLDVGFFTSELAGCNAWPPLPLPGPVPWPSRPGHCSFSASRQLNTAPGPVLFVTPWECVLAVPRLALAFGLAGGTWARWWEEVSKNPGPAGGGEQKPGADRGSGPCLEGALESSCPQTLHNHRRGLAARSLFAVQILLTCAGKLQMVIVTEDANLSWPGTWCVYIYALYNSLCAYGNY